MRAARANPARYTPHLVEERSDLPEAFVAMLTRLLPEARAAAVLHTFTQQRPTTFRVNVARRDPDDVRHELEQAGLIAAAVPWCAAAFVLREGSDQALRETDAYRRGELYVQGLSSMLPPLVLAPQPGELVLDMAAAPGGKTTQMAAQMRGEGRIVACDSSAVRFEKLKSLVRLQGCEPMCELVRKNAVDLVAKRKGAFDRVLLDAPCSSEGRFHTSSPSTWSGWSPQFVAQRAALQRRLLAAALELVRPGGEVVYSTCTFSPEENEEVLQSALATGNAKLLPIDLNLSNAQAAVTSWEGRTFFSATSRAVRILPTDDMEGFFIAHLRTTAP